MSQPTHAAVEAVWRIESARLIAGLTRLVGDVGDAEELAQDALVAALEQWPAEGVPANPGGWLMSTAKHRAIDQLRRRQNYQRKLAEVGRMTEQPPADEPDRIADDVLRLVFITCHPVLRTEGRVASPCGCSAACPRPRSPGPCWSRSRPWASASGGPSAR